MLMAPPSKTRNDHIISEHITSLTHSFLVYTLAVQAMGGRTLPVPLSDYTIDVAQTARAVTSKTRIIFINNANNPIGTVTRKADFDSFLKAVPQYMAMVLDDAHNEFVTSGDTPRGFDYIDRSGPHIRVNAGLPEKNKRFIEALSCTLSGLSEAR
jgi:histidinol-phosphate aminotransferase